MAPSRVPAGAAAPSPDLDPSAVLDIVLDALAGTDQVAAARRVHAFASPRMRSAIGDAAAFERALRTTLYAPLLGRRAGVERLETRGEAARANVTVAEGGTAVRFTVALARARGGERPGCWLLSGIAREGVDL